MADSYFALVQAALHLKDMGLHFIGVVKTAHKGFPMHYLLRMVKATTGPCFTVMLKVVLQ